MSFYRIGVDVGGTNTDAAILDIAASNQPGRGVLASYKAPTTPDITSGIEAAIGSVLESSKVDKGRVLSVNIGTTHFINALVEADSRRLDCVAVVRLCGPFTKQLPPFSDFPVGLRGVLDGGAYYLDGGFEIDGRMIEPLKPKEIVATVKKIVADGVRAVALVGVFSPLDHEDLQEVKCKRMFAEHAPGLQVVCSKRIGQIGFLERENATILNAAILNTAQRVTKGLKQAISRLTLACPLFLSQNDGTIIDIGAAFLAGLDVAKFTRTDEADSRDSTQDAQVLVVDIGGTTTDVCALLPSGFPRPAPGFVELGGVRTAFSVPDVVSIGLGGGSLVEQNATSQEHVTVGPSSVGHAIQHEALVFGGQSMTATDIVVATGKVKLGDPNLVAGISSSVVESAQRGIKQKLETVIDKMKVSQAPVHVLLVGGGAILAPDTLTGVEKCIHPIHEGAANAVGAAIAKVCGEVDVVEIVAGKSADAVTTAARQKAINLAIQRGASPKDVKVVEVNKMPLPYTTHSTIRIQVRAVGRLAVPQGLTSRPSPTICGIYDQQTNGDGEEEEKFAKCKVDNALLPTIKPSLGISLADYCPEVRNGVWYVSEVDLKLISTGCGVLGTGGGGPTHYEYVKSLTALRSLGRGRMRIISPDSLNDCDAVCFGAWYGSPSVLNERIGGGTEVALAVEYMGKALRKPAFQAILAAEIGGGNGMSAFPTSAYLDIPVIDGDSMGRAYPTIYHTTFSVYGYPLVPTILTDAKGNVAIVSKTESLPRLETLLRSTAIELGLACAVAATPRSGSEVKEHGIPNTLSAAWYLGRSIHLARQQKTSYIEAIFDVCPGKLLFSGKIVDVHRYIGQGYTKGQGYTMGAVVIGPVTEDELEVGAQKNSHQESTNCSHMYLPFQNEYLYAALSDAEGSEASQQVACTVPDLISILGQDGEAIGSQDLRYGLRVSVIGMPAHRLWKTEQGLKVGGPEGFGLKIPVCEVDSTFTQPRSVIEEYGT